MTIFVDPGERGLVVGQTGSGKTVMLQEQARQARNAPVVIYDTKGDDGFLDVPMDDESLEIIEKLDDFKSIIRKPKRKQPDYILVRPNVYELRDPDLVDEYLLEHYENLHQSYAIIDEVYQVHRNSIAGPGLLGLLTRGRSKGISTVIATQRPKGISRFCITEVKKIYVYFLMDIDDRKRIAEVSPLDPKIILDNYHFWYYKQGDRTGTVYAPLPLRAPDRGYVNVPDDSGINWL